MHKRTYCMPDHETAMATRAQSVGSHGWSSTTQERSSLHFSQDSQHGGRPGGLQEHRTNRGHSPHRQTYYACRVPYHRAWLSKSEGP
jgi:hypothetical protein